MFIFARCLRNSAAVTPAKYELDIIQVTIVFIIPNNWENNGTEKIGLLTPTPEHFFPENIIGRPADNLSWGGGYKADFLRSVIFLIFQHRHDTC